MAAAAFFGADRLIITTDNPRLKRLWKLFGILLRSFQIWKNSSPEKRNRDFIRVIRDRREAIRRGIGMLEKGDLLLIAGKGHEEYQEICGKKYPFNEREIIAGELKIPFKRL